MSNKSKAMFLGMLLVPEVATIFGQREEIGEDHIIEADMVERVNRAGLNVLCVVVMYASLHSILRVLYRKQWLDVVRQFLHLQALDLIVEVSPRHFFSFHS